jgi:nicotinic acid mononucleotide adenylyltransferase
MVVSKTSSEKEQILLELAESYRKAGDEVSIYPRVESLPSFLKDYDPDMIVHRGQESVVVSVQSRKTLNLTSAHRLRDLVQAVEKQPGWRLEMIMTNSEDAAYTINADRSLQISEVETGLQVLADLMDRSLESAILYAWSLTEATLRLVTEKEGLISRKFDSLYLVKQLATEGIISRDEYRVLMNSRSLRNAIAHGFKTSQLNPDEVHQLIEITKQLLKNVP